MHTEPASIQSGHRSSGQASLSAGDRLVLAALGIVPVGLALAWLDLSSIAALCQGGCASESVRDSYNWSGVILSVATFGVSALMFFGASLSGHRQPARSAGRYLFVGLVVFGLWLLGGSYL